jgi:hypothetical protein
VTSAPLDDLVEEAQRLVAGTAGAGVVARVLGGVGVALHDHGPVPESLCRTYGDIDIVVPAKANKATAAALQDLGYQANERFNALHGARRMLFYDTANGRQLDVFVGAFAMCHELDLSKRLGEHPLALDAADLLLTKLQIAQINRKDIVDGVRLLLTHELSEPLPPTLVAGADSPDLLSVPRLQAVTLARLGEATPGLLLGDGDAAGVVTTRAGRLRAALDDAPKSMRWRARSVIGRKSPWYELPEEVDRGAGR